MGRRADHTPEQLHRMVLDAARSIVRQHGLQALTTRKIANQIGYTVGTLYQIFENVDDLIEQMNAETLDQLRALCDEVDFSAGTAESLTRLVEKYVTFTNSEPLLWGAVIEHKLPKGYQRQELYVTTVLRLLGVVEKAIAPLFADEEKAARLHDARLLWACLYGISGLASADRLAKEESVGRLAGTLIEIYIAARLPARRSPRPAGTPVLRGARRRP